MIGDYAAFYSDLLHRLKKLPVDISKMLVSHLCYRTTTLEEYQTLRERLLADCGSSHESGFNGRPVSVLGLKKPLVLSAEHSVPYIELTAPRPDHMYPSGLEHLGVVVDGDFPGFQKRCGRLLDGQKDHGPFCKPLFKTFENGATIKFYERSLKEVIELEGGRFRSL